MIGVVSLFCWIVGSVAVQRVPSARQQQLAVGTSQTAVRPNIVWVMADDLGVGEVRSHTPESVISTPFLSQFAREGMVFTDAYSGYTVCGPSRAAFFTGRHSGTFHKHGILAESMKMDPSQNLTRLGQMLQHAGYATAIFGKADPLTSPTGHGFDYFLGQEGQVKSHLMYPVHLDTNTGPGTFFLTGNLANRHNRSRRECMANPSAYNYSNDVFHRAGMFWMRQMAEQSKPFFMYLSYTQPHAGTWMNQGEYGAPIPSDFGYAEKLWPDVEKDHAATVQNLDWKVGELLQILKELSIDNRTIVFFASDNGAHDEGQHDPQFFNSTGGLTGWKRSLYEGGVRSPSMARWPGTIPAGRTSNFTWAFWDVVPTLADIVGDSSTPRIPSDGISILPTLLGQDQTVKRYLYWTHGDESSFAYAVRHGRWKGIVAQCDSAPKRNDTMRLYDLSVDLAETTDVAAQHANITDDLKDFVVSEGLSCKCYQCTGGKNAQAFIRDLERPTLKT